MPRDQGRNYGGHRLHCRRVCLGGFAESPLRLAKHPRQDRGDLVQGRPFPRHSGEIEGEAIADALSATTKLNVNRIGRLASLMSAARSATPRLGWNVGPG